MWGVRETDRHVITMQLTTEPIDDQGEPPPELSEDELFGVLQNRRRREALGHLNDRGGPVSTRELADWVAAREHETTPEALRPEERQRVYISLYQSHLPVLEEHGVVDYASSEGVIEATALAGRFDPYLDVPDRPLRPPNSGRSVRRTGLAALGGTGMLAAGWLDLAPAGGLLALTWCGILAASLLLVFRGDSEGDPAERTWRAARKESK